MFERFSRQEVVDHAQDGRALRVRDPVEDLIDLVRVLHLDRDGMRTLQRVDLGTEDGQCTNSDLAKSLFETVANYLNAKHVTGSVCKKR